MWSLGLLCPGYFAVAAQTGLGRPQRRWTAGPAGERGRGQRLFLAPHAPRTRASCPASSVSARCCPVCLGA